MRGPASRVRPYAAVVAANACPSCGSGRNERPAPASAATRVVYCSNEACALHGVPAWRGAAHRVVLNDRGEVVEDAF